MQMDWLKQYLDKSTKMNVGASIPQGCLQGDGRPHQQEHGFDPPLSGRGTDHSPARTPQHEQPLFHRTDALAAMAQRPAGHLESKDGLVAWFELHMAGWKFVVEAEPL